MKITVKAPAGGAAGPLDVEFDPKLPYAYSATLELSAQGMPQLHVLSFVTEADIDIPDDLVKNDNVCPLCYQVVSEKVDAKDGMVDKTTFGCESVVMEKIEGGKP